MQRHGESAGGRSEKMIAIDAMGGDFAPKAACEGAVEACTKRSNLQVVLVGDSAQIEPLIAKAPADVLGRIKIIHTSEVIQGDDHPSVSIRKKKDSSLVVALRMVKEGRADGLVTAGNTGAVAAGGVLILGRLEGIDRPALGIVYPSVSRPVLLLDVGATVHCKPINLYQFAAMGHIYAQIFEHIDNPEVKLLNIGTEDIKGDEAILSAAEMLKADDDINYCGFVEANELSEGSCDVVVCDGFTGNVMIKFAEGLVDLIKTEFKKEFKEHLLPKLGLPFMLPAVKRFSARIDWTKIGHACLLGVNGTVIKVHGRSRKTQLCYAILGADDFVKRDGLVKIMEAIAKR